MNYLIRFLLLATFMLSMTSCGSPKFMKGQEVKFSISGQAVPVKKCKKKKYRGYCIDSCSKADEVHSCSKADFNKLYDLLDGPTVTEVLYEYAAPLRWDYRLHMEDSFAVKHNIYRIRLDFYSQDILELPDARFLLVDVVEGLLGKLNASPLAVAQNGGAPFTVDNLEMYIRFESYFIRYVDLRYVAFVSLRCGLVHFYAGDAFNSEYQCWHKHGETYYQSWNITNAERRGEKLYRELHPIPPSVFDRLFPPQEVEVY